tara:strand:- start:68 stop:286 length:219 start_codon:yes stop_codon:yes gene_type:complete
MGGAVRRVIKPTPPPPPPPVTPTAPEVSQSKAIDAYDPRKTKAKGRSTTIKTTSKGVQDETLTLGTVSLLGQ